MSTLQKMNGLYTENLCETLQCILDHLVPKVVESEETEYNKRIWKFTEELMDTREDRDFAAEEIRSTIKNIDHRKTPGEDDITSRFLKAFLEL